MKCNDQNEILGWNLKLLVKTIYTHMHILFKVYMTVIAKLSYLHTNIPSLVCTCDFFLFDRKGDMPYIMPYNIGI